MKKMKLVVDVALVVLLLTFLTAFSALATTYPTFTLSASSNQLQFALPQGTTFNGTISTTGSLRFFVSDPNGAQIVNLGIIDKNTTFSFVSLQSGTYLLNFENDLHNTIQVTFSYETNPALQGNSNSNGTSLIYLAIPIIIAVAGSFLIIFVVRRKSKIKSSNT
jgi:hypothetical protein